MKTLSAAQPIGIFDSGIGGLTIAKAVVDILPHESIIYFGDTAHLPYGDKSAQTIQGYSRKIVDFLLEQKVKLILVACNSASSAAYDMLQNHVAGRALLVNVIDPLVEFLGKQFENQNIGLIGTKQTVNSKIYQKKIAALGCGITLQALATPLLVPIIEEGFFEHQLIDIAISEYLSHPALSGIKALVLGCTHYPVIKQKISAFYRGKIDLIDASGIVAAAVKNILAVHNLLSQGTPVLKFFVSDYTESFYHGTRSFFGEKVSVKQINIF